ncbi:hypothetical protein [Chryseobacterium sp.]|uniref:hypothetical protein n=1 Tax=Chryseobacterium sp. TaxID=1871047 RepID=UPI002843992B|nr:hypothetical protein [Chryseobacterium sp.]MDR3025015.1 hypothetical protein [Chryseobacterium sp.]
MKMLVLQAFLIFATVSVQAQNIHQIQAIKAKGYAAIDTIGQPALDQVSSVNTQVFVENPRRHMYFSLIGGTKETREMAEYSMEHKIFPKVEIIPITKINQTSDDVVKGEPALDM